MCVERKPTAWLSSGFEVHSDVSLANETTRSRPWRNFCDDKNLLVGESSILILGSNQERGRENVFSFSRGGRMETEGFPNRTQRSEEGCEIPSSTHQIVFTKNLL
jgi:hypothetical protein